MTDKLNTNICRDAIYEWVEKWFELSLLIIEVTSIDEPPYTPPIPTDLDEINYQRLRFWLKENETHFVSLWQEFYACQDWAVKYGDLESELNDCLSKNPFSCLYVSENLYHLAKELELQSGIDVWEPSKRQANIANGFIIHMGKTLLTFLDWLDDMVRAF